MDNEVKEFLAALQKKLVSIDYIKTEDIPNIGLYMDQVTTFMDEQLEACKRYEDDKILTKTMINNYAKNNLLPAPEKKKYSKEHVLTLLFIYYFKNLLSINDIQSLLNPLTEHYFGNKAGFNMEDVYNEETYLQKEGKTGLVADFLYDSIAQYGFINEHHRDAIESAWLFHDMEFLQQQWEYYALAQIRSLRAVIVSMLGTVPTTPETEPQNAKREPKRIEDYPEVFDITLYCELTNYAKDTIYKWTRTREIPCHRSGTNGRKLVFKRDEIVAWMTARKQETKDEFIKRMES